MGKTKKDSNTRAKLEMGTIAAPNQSMLSKQPLETNTRIENRCPEQTVFERVRGIFRTPPSLTLKGLPKFGRVENLGHRK